MYTCNVTHFSLSIHQLSPFKSNKVNNEKHFCSRWAQKNFHLAQELRSGSLEKNWGPRSTKGQLITEAPWIRPIQQWAVIVFHFCEMPRWLNSSAGHARWIGVMTPPHLLLIHGLIWGQRRRPQATRKWWWCFELRGKRIGTKKAIFIPLYLCNILSELPIFLALCCYLNF